MKIAYLLGSLNRGGTETLLLDVFRNSDKANFDCIGIHRKRGVYYDNFYATKPLLFQLTPKFPFSLSYLFRLHQLLKKKEIQVVHTHQYLDTLYAKVACLGTKIQVIQTLHGYDNIDPKKKNKLLNLSLRLTVLNIFVSKSQEKYYIKKYELNPSKQQVIYNGISFEKLDNVPEQVLQPVLSNKKSDAILLGSVGNFVRGRDQMTICRFLKLLKKSGCVFDFVFVGGKNNADPLLYDNCFHFCKENNLLDSVHFLGSRQDVPNILRQLDAFIYSTDHDTFGIAVIEAIASGLPVFVNDWEVMKEITSDGKYAVLYKTKNEQDLFDKFQLFLQDMNKYKETAKQAKLEVRNQLSIEKHIACLEDIYTSLQVKIKI